MDHSRHPLLPLLLLGLIASLGSSLSLYPNPKADPSVVTIPSGTLQGVARATSRFFKGIPYAKPPVGDLRWRNPQTPTPWNGTWDATDFRWNCAQSTNFDPPMTNLSEDCLYLNVYAPLPPADGTTLYPVLFWIHGGGFTNGGSNESRANGTWQVELRKDIVVVTINYRLNIFGFLGSDDLRNRSTDGGSGNYGMQDQIFALNWVKSNIRYFYGDPNNVMIYGESAGGAAVGDLLVMAPSFGLYHKAVMESGGFSYFSAKNWDATQQVYKNVLTATGCQNVNCLLAISASDLVTLSTKIPSPCRDQGAWSPAIDGKLLTDYPWFLVQNGAYAKVPVMAGTMKDEQLTGLSANATQTDFNNYISNQFGSDFVAPINQLYPASNYPPTADANSYWWASTQVNADFSFAAASRRAVRWFSQWGSWLYLFTYPKPVSWGPGGASYAAHAEELPFVFLAENLLNGTNEIALSTNVVWYWTNFAVGSNPNSGGAGGQPLFNWPRYQNSSDYNIFLDVTLVNGTGLRSAALDFWDSKLVQFSTCRQK